VHLTESAVGDQAVANTRDHRTRLSVITDSKANEIAGSSVKVSNLALGGVQVVKNYVTHPNATIGADVPGEDRNVFAQ